MCGRYSIAITVKDKNNKASRVARLLEKYKLEAHYNAAPSQLLPVVTADEPDKIQLFSWGLVPHWSKDQHHGNKPINARAETLLEKPSFRELVSRRHCLVPADGFYEWRKTASGKVPYRFLLKSEELFSFAGLWDEWADTETGEMQRTFTIITMEANELVKPTHDRMPVILSPEKEEAWLDVTKGNNLLQQFLRPFPAEEMKSYAVSALVNSVSNNSANLLQQVPEQGSLF
ncbi:SOS response-associated peptidase [Pontibacter sp. KCTC 32443]|uniref:SOS response-associated peptidase n=1 Tax=Pontibacter TaxID=323449 RepID=UPI00164E0293|nr:MULTISPECIES: SOS response-associated peptidase [Pontibacter]MBC5772763.1 SOS response-associated peptidase [Pontibacter sp. KCTC 32443]